MRAGQAVPAAPRAGAPADPERWLLAPADRGNPDTTIDTRRADGASWTEGNRVTPLVHGATYFAALLAAVEAMGPGDLLLFTDWRGDPDERLDGPGTEVGRVFAAAAGRGVDVRGLVWRSHWDRLRFSAAENRHLGEEIDAAGGRCLLDMRVRPLGSHHQKLVVLRHRDRPHDDVAYVGGIDLCHSRRDDASHHGDEQPVRMAAVYGPRPPWHDVQLEIRGPAVGDAEAVFRERWEDRTPLTLNPVRRLRDLARRTPVRPLPPQHPDPAPAGTAAVQLLRTYPRRVLGYPFARSGERSVARGYLTALRRARRIVYLEDQYLWSRDVAAAFAGALRRAPELRLVVVVPLHPDEDGRDAVAPAELGRWHAMQLLRRAGGDRVGVYGVENEAGTPIYVHAKVCVVDDAWACIGSDNANLRSWTHDSELSAAFVERTTRGTARTLRLGLAAEHLGDASPGDDALDDASSWFDAYRTAAAALDAWYAGGRRGPRPPGRLRTYRAQRLSRSTRLWAEPLYRWVHDPDGRPLTDRLARRF